LRQVILRPVQQRFKRIAIVRRKGKEQGIALPFGGGYLAGITWVDDARHR
jgi:hypothetical protein